MANPVDVVCAADAWTKVATNVTSGFVWIRKQSVECLQVYVMTGGAAPTLRSEGVQFDYPGAPISALAGIDVYVWPMGDANTMRVDL